MNANAFATTNNTATVTNKKKTRKDFSRENLKTKFIKERTKIRAIKKINALC